HRAAESALPEGAFLRRDRGDALFVSDAPRRSPDDDWTAALARAGFISQLHGGLASITPGTAWLIGLEADWPDPPDLFCASLFRFAGRTPDDESLALFALGARVLDGEMNDGRFERRLRRRAAECLRLERTQPTAHGGGLYACALLRHFIKEASL
ncbi:MAG: hypothetical protein IJ769_09715, partial [Clostridia bacterium]|nr:hypothetical protein [Clostridia bacterium]